ncbi:MAG TPA: DUF6496 domain-containing protein [Chitinophagaceae bacterium]|nr:DUF6496 domain-containing protein [Chitinophagaceae bacterium]
MAKYSKKAQEKVEKVMHERKKGTLKSGGSGKTVKSRKQAIAIGLSEARRAGAKVPKKKAARKKSATKKKTASRTGPSRKKSATTRSTRKKSVTKKRGRG